MSVYKRPGAKTYSFDFELRGHRFSGDTGATSKREAERFQEVERAKERARLEKQPASGSDLPFSHAAARYMVEVGEHHRNWKTTLTCLEWLERELGKTMPLSLINDDVVAKLVAKRRAQFRKVGKKGTTPRKLVGPATVNRTVTEPLRKVMLRAQKVWKSPVGDVNWRQHLLKEPKERIREASTGEEAAVLAEVGAGYDDAVRFAFMNGCRAMEIEGLRWPMVDFFGRQFTVIGKGGKARVIPMSQATFDLLWEQRGRHEEFVFTYAAKRTDARKGLVKGQRYPVTNSGLRITMSRAAKRANIENLRFHDTRHTAATRVLRKSNLKVVQNLLGHERITTTEKYAHALAEDIRAALEAANPTEIPTTDGASTDKHRQLK